MELVAYVFPGWSPRLRPAAPRRDWMDASPESFAYRCLPLKIANEHGWELLSPCGFSAEWNGGPLAGDVAITVDPGTSELDAPVALFGQATLTFHVPALFRTPPGWNLSIGGTPNAAKDGIAALGGIIETDWSPYSFTMNWRFTRAHHRVRFEIDEPIALLMPVERAALERFEARIAPIDEAPDLKAQFEAWSQSRQAFQRAVAANPPQAPTDRWQKLYYRGLEPDGAVGSPDHQARVRPCPFTGFGQ
ncbi:hypothetical protein KX816_01430 [Sphingosinicellaceae bacterium]|nr:hypothetical protein KX816_01430 [Sphingosinicellaceae bacterium]